MKIKLCMFLICEIWCSKVVLLCDFIFMYRCFIFVNFFGFVVIFSIIGVFFVCVKNMFGFFSFVVDISVNW